MLNNSLILFNDKNQNVIALLDIKIKDYLR